MSFASKQNTRSPLGTILTVGLVLSVGLWGCARKPVSKAANPDRLRAVEGRCVKLEQDYRTVAQARDQATREVAVLEETIARLQKELAATEALAREHDRLRNQFKTVQGERDEIRQTLVQRTAERDEMKQQVSVRATERDALQGRCERLRKGLQGLLTQDDVPFGVLPAAQAGPANAPVAGTPAPAGPNLGGQS
jgi:chromosome segregation ATPase